MAQPIRVVIGVRSVMSVGRSSIESSVSVTYALDSGETDVVGFVGDKVNEVSAAQRLAFAKASGEGAVAGQKPDSPCPDRVSVVVTGGDSVPELVPGLTNLQPVGKPRESNGSAVARPMLRLVTGGAASPAPEPDHVYQSREPGVTEAQIGVIAVLCGPVNLDARGLLHWIHTGFKKSDLADLTQREAAQLILKMTRVARRVSEENVVTQELCETNA